MTDDAAEAPKKRMGRPPKPVAEVKRHGIAFRVNDRLREQIQQSAEQNQRSVAEEVEYRLQLSSVVAPILEDMTTDKATQQFFRALSKTMRSVRAVAQRANLNEVDTRIALAAALRYVSEINFWTGGEVSPPPEGYIGSMDQPPRKRHELPPAAIGYSVASDVMLSGSIWEECALMDDFGDVIADHWSGDGSVSVNAEPSAPTQAPTRSLESIMAEVNPRDRQRGRKVP